MLKNISKMRVLTWESTFSLSQPYVSKKRNIFVENICTWCQRRGRGITRVWEGYGRQQEGRGREGEGGGRLHGLGDGEQVVVWGQVLVGDGHEKAALEGCKMC